MALQILQVLGLVTKLTWLLRKSMRLSADDNASLLAEMSPVSLSSALLVWYSSAHLKN